MTPQPAILAGDIGGTKTNLALFAVKDGEAFSELRSASFQSADFPGLEAVVAAFLGPEGGDESRGGVRAACFGIAGPVVDGRVVTPNLAWEVDGERLAGSIPAPRVLLLNDLVATAYGIPALGGPELEALQEGDPAAAERGNRALIAAGTGLGMALLPRVGGDWLPVASEGGHMDFAPRSEEEIELLGYLSRRFGGHVSLERVVSGPGLVHLYEFLRDGGREAPSPPVEAALLGPGDAAKAIGTEGLTGDGICGSALRLFVSLYGAAAGNLALLGTATGGIYLGGGIAPRILPLLRGAGFLSAFRAKGRFHAYLERIAVRVILNDRAAVLGAARRAARLAVDREGPFSK